MRRPPLFALVALSACGGASALPAVQPVPAASTAPAAVAPVCSPGGRHGCAGSPDAPVVLQADTPESLASGATFTAPGGWTLTLEAGRALLVGPEADLRLAIVESAGADADGAVAAGWTAVRPDFRRTLKVAEPRPGRRGWEERRDYDYETSPNERVLAFASALRHGKTWTAVVVEGSQASFDKRAAAVSLVEGSLRPEGFVRESFAGKKPHELDATRVKAIVDSVDKNRALAGIPGVGLALVQDGRVVYEGGLGVRELGKPAPVDARTLFMVASNTKALTTLLLARLVDQGKLGWETPVTALYPSFELGDADTTRQVLVKHLVCACTGLPRQDMEFLFEGERQTPRGEIALLGTMQPTTKFGETFQYSNPLAAAAGFIAGHVLFPNRELGAAYDEAMAREVFGPLGMKDTTFDFDRAVRGDHASPHGYGVDGIEAPAPLEVDRVAVPIRPAGEAWSSAHDMIQYVAMELAKGKLPTGARYVSEDALLARRKPQVLIGEHETYGMGLMVNTETGVAVVHHGGDLIGYHSDMFWIPDAGVGGVILTNGDGWLVRKPFIRRTLEVLFDGAPEADDDAAAAIRQQKAALAAERPHLVLPPDPEVAGKLARRYASPALGTLTVIADGPRRLFDFGGWRTVVASRKNEDGTSSMVTTTPEVSLIEFVITEREGKRALVLRDMQHEYVFLEAR